MAVPVRIALAFLLAAGLIPAPAASAASAETLRFDVTRDGLPFGRHVIAIQSRGGRTEVENSADAKVALGPVVLFSYAYNSHEIWENGRLRRISAWTNDDGRETSVTAEAVADGIRVIGPDGQAILPASVVPTSFWTIAAARNSALLDTQTGQLANVTTRFLGVEDGTQGSLYRYRLSGDLNSELWYDTRGLLARARFNARGSMFEYVRIPDAPKISSQTSVPGGGS